MFPDKKDSPIDVFAEWFNDVKNYPIEEPNAMNLATCGKNGTPSSRIVLMKSFDENGFVFFTNLGSRKALQLQENPKCSLCFYWNPIGRQVRINGIAKEISSEESDEYFATRPRESQIGAWSSRQSQPMKSRKDILMRIAQKTAKFGVRKIPRPPFWGGFRVKPETIEFWQRGDFRIHKRLKFTRDAEIWTAEKLYP